MDTTIITIIIGGILAVIFIISIVSSSYTRAQQTAYQRSVIKAKNFWRQRYNDWRNEVDKNGNDIEGLYTTSRIFLNKNESCLYAQNDVELFKPKSIRYGSGTYGGVAAGGFHGGGFSSTSESQLEYRYADVGTVCITNKRFLFIGEKETSDIPIDKIISYDNNLNTFELRIGGSHGRITANGARTLCMENIDGYIVKDILETVKDYV